MAEVITETILPGTYIEVRAEGLLTVGAISTGNVGIIGTAEKGNGKTIRLSSFADAKANFGETGEWDTSAPDDNLNLVRSLKLLFDNGARTVYARRVMDEQTSTTATHDVLSENGGPLLKLNAKSAGTWGNRLQVRIQEADESQQIENELVPSSNGSYILSATNVVLPDDQNERIGTITVREQGLSRKYAIKQIAPSEAELVVQIDSATRKLTFATPPGSLAQVRASYTVPKESLRQVTLAYSADQETYTVPSASYLAQRLTDPTGTSTLVGVEVLGEGLPGKTNGFEPFANGSNGSVSTTHYKEALDLMVDEDVQILVAARKFSDMRAAMLGHVEKTENQGRERIAVLGADSSTIGKILDNANEVADKRAILVAPGIKEKSEQTGRIIELPSYFTAAAIAGKLAGLAPHISLTNKTLAGIENPAMEYNYGQKTALVQNRILVLEKKRGIRVIKGITTHDEAFKQITLRRIVDYIKQGTRLGANQYIGKLNNDRVRGNLYTTLDSFLSDMVTREFLTQYNLTVTADRQMEIRGEVQVVMDLYPTFSIDVIRVTMNLQ